MKTQIKLILLSFSIVLGVMLTSVATAAQIDSLSYDYPFDANSSMKINMVTFLDGEYTRTDDIYLTVINETAHINYTCEVTSDVFIYLEYDQIYRFEVTRKGYIKKSFDISTYAPKRTYDIKCNVYLYDSDIYKDQYTGRLVYDQNIGKFRHYKE